MDYTQENRIIAIETPLDPDKLLLARLSGKEGISMPFSFELDLLSTDSAIVFEDIIGKDVSISIVLADGSKRYFHGIISSLTQTRGSGGADASHQLALYKAVMVPKLWLLTRTLDSRIFQNLSVVDIVEQVLKENQVSDIEINVAAADYEKLEYCVQYQETDFNFISRLLEHEGIYYYFRHEKNKHTMVISDSPKDHLPLEKEDVRCMITAGGLTGEDMITALRRKKEIQSGKYTMKDFNFETPAADLKVEVTSATALGPGDREVYVYPGEYQKTKAGQRLANIRMQEKEAGVTTITGTGNCRAFTSGYRFTLKDHYRDEMNDQQYVLTRVAHEASETYEAADTGAEATYANSFTCIPFDVPYRPQRLARKPFIAGAQTAIVTGPSGDEIHTDKHGRVKVQFHWDRQGKKDDKTSCWIRVSQAWAGQGFGIMFLPRIGQEVIVEFLEGDPDRPIVTGRVYHGTNTPPYSLPDQKTKSTIKTNSSTGGDGFNEIRLEDKKGEEQIFIHAEKNLDVRVKAGMFETVGGDSNIVVANNRLIKVDKDLSETITENRIEMIGKDLSITASGKENRVVGDKLSVQVGSDVAEQFGGNHSEVTDGDVYIKAGGNLVIEAGTNITLKVGGSHIAMESSGITIKTTGPLELESASKALLKGAMVNVDASAIAEIKGSLVKIN